MSYYYAIFLPPVFAAKVLARLGMSMSVFGLQVLFILWTGMMIGLMIANLQLQMKKQAWIFFGLLFLIGGFDGLHVLLNKQLGSVLFADIQNGGINQIFLPLRIQDFTSYVFFIPGHVMSSVAALTGIILIERGHGSGMKKFFALSLPLFVFSTSIFAFFGYCFYLFLAGVDWLKIHHEKKKDLIEKVKNDFFAPEIFLFLTVVAAMVIFYGGKREPHALDVLRGTYSVSKISFFLLQELLPFALAAALLKIKDWRYYASIVFISFLCCVGSRALMMSTSILPILYLIYKIACCLDFKNRRAVIGMAIISLLYLPSQMANVAVIFDFQNKYEKNMSESTAIGNEVADLPDVLKEYTMSVMPKR